MEWKIGMGSLDVGNGFIKADNEKYKYRASYEGDVVEQKAHGMGMFSYNKHSLIYYGHFEHGEPSGGDGACKVYEKRVKKIIWIFCEWENGRFKGDVPFDGCNPRHMKVLYSVSL